MFLCTPALVYFVFVFTQIVIDLYKHEYEYAVIKFIILIFITLLLNELCKRGFDFIAWVIVLIPYMYMVFMTLLLLFFIVSKNKSIKSQPNQQPTSSPPPPPQSYQVSKPPSSPPPPPPQQPSHTTSTIQTQQPKKPLPPTGTSDPYYQSGYIGFSGLF